MSFLAIYLRGMAMGAADIVPGVSGGTVAFITGIYEPLLNSIKSLNPSALQLLWLQGFKAFWRHINGPFLSALLLGMASSIILFAGLISHLLEAQPLLIWSFFFGLIAASALHMARQINHWNLSGAFFLLLGLVVAYGFTEMKPSELTATPLLVFAAGSIAICAMILPGISGSFMLLLMGLYSPILLAFKEFNIVILVSFIAGCGVGILSFAHLLSGLLSRFYAQTMSVLTGFLIGSLNLVWPWKQTLSYYSNSKGRPLALEQQNVLPQQFAELTGLASELVYCSLLALFAVVFVLLLEKKAGKSGNASKKI